MACITTIVVHALVTFIKEALHGMYLAIVSRYPVTGTAQSTLGFTSLADLFIQTPFRLLLEAFSHAAITARRLFVHTCTNVYRQILIYATGCSLTTSGERNCHSFETTARGFQLGLFWLNVRRSNRYATAQHKSRDGTLVKALMERHAICGQNEQWQVTDVRY